MGTVHVFISSGRFASPDALRDFIDRPQSDDGAEPPSPLMLETGMDDCDPMAVEAIWAARPRLLGKLLKGASHAGQWLPPLRGARADSAICIFSPNQPAHPERCSLEYIGAFDYEP